MEIAPKDVLDAAYARKRDTDWLELLKVDPTASPGGAKRVPKEHSLPLLLFALRTALAAIGFPEVPEEVIRVTEQLTTLEAAEPI